MNHDELIERYEHLWREAARRLEAASFEEAVVLAGSVGFSGREVGIDPDGIDVVFEAPSGGIYARKRVGTPNDGGPQSQGIVAGVRATLQTLR